MSFDDSLKTDSEETATSEASPTEEKTDEPSVDVLVAQVKDLQDQLSSYQKQIVDYQVKVEGIRDYVKKMEGEVVDIRHRAQRDLQKSTDQATGKFLNELLPIADNFERSVTAAQQAEGPLADGVRLIHQQFKDFLSKAGLVKIETKGKVFDPHIHEAITTMPSDSEGDGKIVEEVKAGYMFRDSVLRPAQVVVGKASDAAA